MERVPGLPLPADRCFPALTGGFLAGLRRIAFKTRGHSAAMAAPLGDLNPAVIHAHFEDGGIQALPLARHLGVPLLTTCHGSDVTIRADLRRKNPLQRAWHSRRQHALMDAGAKFIAVSNHIRKKMLDRGYPEERIVTHYIGVDTEVFAPGFCPPDSNLVLFVGRLVEKKGASYLIKAMARVRSKIPTARLVIVGDGPMRPALESLARAENAPCEFLGIQPPSRVKELMSRAALLAAPSVTAENGDTEGLPLVVCEAQAMGLPVVGFFHAGIPEAVIHGATGLLTAEKNVAGLADHLGILLSDEALRERFGTAARRRMCEQFDLETQTLKLEVLYREVARTTELETIAIA